MRSIDEWISVQKSPETRVLLSDLIAAIQADALEAAAKVCERPVPGFDGEPEPIAPFCANEIRSLIPPATQPTLTTRSAKT